MTNRLRGAAFTAAISLVTACSAAIPPFWDTAPAGRLPGTVVPRHYELAMTIAPESERFSGDVAIAVEFTRPTRTIWIHAESIDPVSVTLATPGGQSLEGVWHGERDGVEGVVAIRLPRRVGPGSGTLRIRYTAPFDERLRGLYRVEVDGRSYAFTQFEALDARLAFPSFDEPAYKTPFDITLTVPSGDAAITNTLPVSAVSVSGGRTRTRFATTVPLPTYLIAFGVGPLDVIQADDLPPRGLRTHAVPFRGVAAAGRGADLDFALRNTPPLLVAFEDWFGSPFPYAKLDILAVPDFGAGAMENAAAITFRDSLLLFDGLISEQDRRRFTYVMAHELAHSWFGNTVTMPWWNDIWLNEAFATWLGWRIVGSVAPEQNAEVSLLDAVHRAMQIDGRSSARAIRQPIESNHDVHNAFDGITYSKGAGVLGMFERWIGPEAFRDGVRDYIEAHRDGNATTRDLVDALSNASGRNLTGPFRSFLIKPGVPFVATQTLCDAAGPRLALHQERYVPLGSEADRDSLWQVPVCARHALAGEVGETCTLLGAAEGVLELPGDACPDWVMPNAGAAGYYRWAQSPGDAEKLIETGFDALEAPERLSLASNLEAAFRAGGASIAQTFGAFEVLARDENRAVATAPMPLLKLARNHLLDETDRTELEELTSTLYADRLRALGWDPAEGESGETALLRRAVVEALAFTARDEGVRAEAARRAQRYAGIDALGPADPTALAPDLVDVAMRVAVQDGGTRIFDALAAQLHGSDDAIERRHRLAALGAADQPLLVARAQSLALDERLRVNETTSTLWPLVRRTATQETTWQFIEENFEALVDRTGPGGAGALPWLASGLCSAAAAERVEAFLAPRAADLDGGPRNLAGALESIRQCDAIREAHTEGAREYFADPPEFSDAR